MRAADVPEVVFSYEQFDFTDGSEFGDAEVEDMYIYPLSSFHDTAFLRPRSELQRLSDWIAAWPLQERERQVHDVRPAAKKKKLNDTEMASSGTSGWIHDLLAVEEPAESSNMDVLVQSLNC
eukprot:5949565-Amphidinium_carterae.2